MRVIVGISGASGAIYAVKLMELLRQSHVETDLVVSDHGAQLLEHETGLRLSKFSRLAARSYSNDDVSAPIASGSYPFDAMAIVPCSMSTAAKISVGIGDNLMTRAAAVALKERRRLVLAVRETPLSAIHLRALAVLSDAGAVVMPAMPAFYDRPASIDELAEGFARRLMGVLGAPGHGIKPWPGLDVQCPAQE